MPLSMIITKKFDAIEKEMQISVDDIESFIIEGILNIF